MTTISWPAKATTDRVKPTDMDGHYLVKVLHKDKPTLKPWNDCIKTEDLDGPAGNMPPFFRDLRSDQAGHLYAYIHQHGASKAGFSLKDLGFYYPANFDVSGTPLSKKKPWGPAYDGDYAITKKRKGGEEDVESLDSIFLEGKSGYIPIYAEAFPLTYTSCWRRMPTMPLSSGEADGNDPSEASSSSKKRRLTLDLDSDINDGLAESEKLAGKKGLQRAALGMVRALKNDIQDQKGLVEDAKLDVMEAKKKAAKAYKFERMWKRVAKSRDFYKNLLGDVMKQSKVASVFLEASLQKADESFTCEDELDEDDSDYDYDVDDNCVGPRLDSLAMKNRLIEFIEDVLEENEEELHTEFATGEVARGDPKLKRYTARNVAKDSLKGIPKKKEPENFQEESSSDDEDMADEGNDVEKEESMRQLKAELKNAKTARHVAKVEVTKFKSAMKGVLEGLIASGVLGKDGSGQPAPSDTTQGGEDGLPHGADEDGQPAPSDTKAAVVQPKPSGQKAAPRKGTASSTEGGNKQKQPRRRNIVSNGGVVMLNEC